MDSDSLDMLSTFADEKVKYLLVGGHALAAHGFIRATEDVDLWVEPSAENAQRVWRALAKFGAPMQNVTPDDFTSADLIFQIGIKPHRIDVLTAIAGVSFEDAWPRRTEAVVDGIAVPVIGREDLICNKQTAGRPQDLADVRRLTRKRSPKQSR